MNQLTCLWLLSYILPIDLPFRCKKETSKRNDCCETTWENATSRCWSWGYKFGKFSLHAFLCSFLVKMATDRFTAGYKLICSMLNAIYLSVRDLLNEKLVSAWCINWFVKGTYSFMVCEIDTWADCFGGSRDVLFSTNASPRLFPGMEFFNLYTKLSALFSSD